MTSGALALVRSAFGRSATLYDALQCPGGKDASQQQLKKCYRRVALRFHPDKCRIGADDRDREQLLRESTLKFQAASASYEVLSDARRKAIYDATGRDDDEQDVHGGGRSSPGSASQSKADDQKRWDEFFRSVFHEVMSSGSRHGDADSYRGSKEEEADVRKYYSMCKGDLVKVGNCIVHGGDEADRRRWKRDIIDPAIVKGHVVNYFSTNSLFDSDEDQPSKVGTAESDNKRRRLGKKKKKLARKAPPSSLIDTDDEEDLESTGKASTSSGAPVAMSKRDKMEYRVAKKRKQKAASEIEVANIMKGKNWSGVSNIDISKRTHSRPGTFNDSLLSDLERTYTTTSSAKNGKKRK